MNNDEPAFRDIWAVVQDVWPHVYPFLGGIGGSTVALGLAANASASAAKKAFNLLSGALIAIFMGPIIVNLVPSWVSGGHMNADSKLAGGIYFIVGLCGTSLMERVVLWGGKWVDKLPAPARTKESE